MKNAKTEIRPYFIEVSVYIKVNFVFPLKVLLEDFED